MFARMVQSPAAPSFEDLLHHPETLAAIERVLRRYGFTQDLEDGRQTVLVKALAWKGHRPTTLTGTRAFCMVVAQRYGAGEYRRKKRREATGDAGPTDLADENVAPVDTEFDRIDLQRLLAVLDATVPDDVREMFRDVAAGTAQRDIASERGIPYAKVRADLEKGRFKLRHAIAVAGLGGLLVTGVWLLFLRTPAPPKEEAHPTPSAPPSQVLVQETPGPAPKEQAAALRAEASTFCAAQDWQRCVDKLDLAKDLDPEGDGVPQVHAMREKAERENEAKTIPK
jgi:DNA-directed RNA polymerase specialized sigma24 family protein